MLRKRVWTYGLVLNRRFWEDRPYVVTTLTPKFGVVDIKLSGKKRESHNTGALEPMALSWFEAEISPLGTHSHHWELIELFGSRRLASPEEMLKMGTIMEESLPKWEPVPGLFTLALRSLKRGEANRDYPMLLRFTVGFLELMGYGIEELVGGREKMRRRIREDPEGLLAVCTEVLKEALGVTL